MTALINQNFAVPSSSSEIITVAFELLLYAQPPSADLSEIELELVLPREGWTQKMSWCPTHKHAKLLIAKNTGIGRHRAEMVIFIEPGSLRLVGGANISIDLRDSPIAGDWEFPVVGAATMYAAAQPKTAEYAMCLIACNWLSSIVDNWAEICRRAMGSETRFSDTYKEVSRLLLQDQDQDQGVAESETAAELYSSEAEHIVVLLDEACSRSGLEVACPVQGFADLPAHVSAVLDALWMRIP